MSLARSRPSITSWRLTEWLIVSALLGEQMVFGHAPPAPASACLNPSSSAGDTHTVRLVRTDGP